MWSGDKNTKFFHAQVAQRRCTNQIQGPYNDDGDWVSGDHDIQRVVLDYFDNIFSSSNPTGADAVVEGISSSITATMNQALTRDVSKDEVREAIMQFSPCKAPRSDGMTASFYQKNWDIVGDDVFRAVAAFFRSGNIPSNINCTHIALIPKVKSPTRMQQLRPISLCNISYKVVVKVLANN